MSLVISPARTVSNPTASSVSVTGSGAQIGGGASLRGARRERCAAGSGVPSRVLRPGEGGLAARSCAPPAGAPPLPARRRRRARRDFGLDDGMDSETSGHDARTGDPSIHGVAAVRTPRVSTRGVGLTSYDVGSRGAARAAGSSRPAGSLRPTDDRARPAGRRDRPHQRPRRRVRPRRRRAVRARPGRRRTARRLRR